MSDTDLAAPNPNEIDVLKINKIQTFYGDQGGKKGFEAIDKFAMELLQAASDPNHNFHKTLGKSEISKLIQGYMEHLLRRQEKDLHKMQHFIPMEGTMPAANTVISINGGAQGFAETVIPEFQ